VIILKVQMSKKGQRYATFKCYTRVLSP
jgi:hypothetical protein